jgi:hypothetical protein
VAIETFAVGSYAATYDGTSTGLTKDGYRITHDQKSEVIDKSDLYGDMMLDAIWRGANVSCEYTCLAFTKGTPVLTAFQASLYSAWSSTTPMGRLFSDLAKALVLTVTANTPAAAVGVGPATLTATKAILAPNYSTTHLYDNRLRELPLRVQFLPYSSTGTLIFAATT